jgi:methylenetetrahydrofolate dehydrogenase (NADP+)/methenyltetrahydrofolate cyclohydrolase
MEGNPILTKPLVQALRSEIRSALAELRQRQQAIGLLALVIASEDPAIQVYLASQRRIAENLGLPVQVVDVGPEVTQAALTSTLTELSASHQVAGIVLELPLAGHLDSEAALSAISGHKDVEGLGPYNLSLLAAGREGEALLAPTPLACLTLAETQVALQGTRVAVIGSGRTVGKPLIWMLLNRGATVTVCTPHTRDLAELLSEVEVIFLAAGKPKLIGPELVRPHHVIIDAGINFVEDRLVGDADAALYPLVRSYSPVPGGVGTLTGLLLFRNYIQALRWGMAHGG